MGSDNPDPQAAVRTALLDGRAQFTRRLLYGDAIGAREVMSRVLDVAPPSRIYFEVVQAALYDIGRRWERGEVSVAQEHLATRIADVVMVDLAPSLPREEPRGRVAIVACAAHELHDIGSRIVADFLAADGWVVLSLGAMTPSGALAELAAARRADVVALSATMADHLPDLARASMQLARAATAPVPRGRRPCIRRPRGRGGSRPRPRRRYAGCARPRAPGALPRRSEAVGRRAARGRVGGGRCSVLDDDGASVVEAVDGADDLAAADDALAGLSCDRLRRDRPDRR